MSTPRSRADIATVFAIPYRSRSPIASANCFAAASMADSFSCDGGAPRVAQPVSVQVAQQGP